MRKSEKTGGGGERLLLPSGVVQLQDLPFGTAGIWGDYDEIGEIEIISNVKNGRRFSVELGDRRHREGKRVGTGRRNEGTGNSHTAGEGSISRILEAEEITTSSLVDGNIKEALDL